MTPLLKTARFRIAFAIWWGSWVAIHTMALHNAAVSWKAALTDSFTCNIILAGAVLLVALSLQYYTPQKNKYGYLLSLCAVLSLLYVFCSRAVLIWIAGEAQAAETFSGGSLLLRGATAFLSTGCMALIAALWYTLQEQAESAQRKTEAEQLAREAELNNLRQQLQPHFLFNSLNSINALVVAQPAKARQMIQQLSDFLRGTLKKDQKEWADLTEELQHLQLYLDIEKVRFGHRLSTDVFNEAAGAKIPVMLLQPVLENAIKFGLYDTLGAITITLTASLAANGLLIVHVTNPFDPATSGPQKGVGFGLRSVQRRLYLLFARNDLLQTTTEHHLFTTTIKIPQP